jgi:hypothetical protein
MSKIGQTSKMKQKDKGPYYVIGLAETVDGYEVRRIKMLADEVESVQVLLKAKYKAEVMMRLQTEVSAYIIDFNQRGEK